MSDENGTSAIAKDLADRAREVKRGKVGTTRRPSLAGVVLPVQNGTGDPAKAWPKGQPAEMAARAKTIREDKSRRDRERAKRKGS